MSVTKATASWTSTVWFSRPAIQEHGANLTDADQSEVRPTQGESFLVATVQGDPQHHSHDDHQEGAADKSQGHHEVSEFQQVCVWAGQLKQRYIVTEEVDNNVAMAIVEISLVEDSGDYG